MVKLTIDGRPVEVARGATVLDAARALGIAIPTLCHLPGVKENRPSCLACVVRIGDDPKVVPSCSTVATDGMVVHSETPDVRAMRKSALELLFSDHLGDCVSICQRVCPARLPIPAMIRCVAAGDLPGAIALAKDAVVFPGVLGRICKAPCEKGCRRSKHDGAVEIMMLERSVADADRAAAAPHVPSCAALTGKRIAIVGAGATGLSAAFFLRRAGHGCVVLDAGELPGGALRYGTNESDLPREVLEFEIATIVRMGVELRANVRLGREVTLERLRADHDAVLLCVGDVKKTGDGLGVDLTPRGIKVDAAMLQTNVPGVFAAGAAVRGGFDPARSVGEGRVLAECVDAFLTGKVINAAQKLFTSTIPRLTADEQVEITKGANAALSPQALIGTAATAAGRCRHCDCRAANDCRLRNVSAAYGVDVNAFTGPHRRRFQFVRQPAGVIFEPGKCISCGICVEIAAKERVPLGLTFIGRGFDLKVSVPPSAGLTQALDRVADESVRHCPTGALAFEGDARQAAVREAGGHRAAT